MKYGHEVKYMNTQKQQAEQLRTAKPLSLQVDWELQLLSQQKPQPLSS